MSAFCTQRNEILFSILVARNPGVPFLTMKQLTWPDSLLRAHTTQTSAHVPLPIQRFWPSRTQPPGTLVALVVRPLASLPLDGSVSAQQPTCGAARGGLGVVSSGAVAQSPATPAGWAGWHG